MVEAIILPLFHESKRTYPNLYYGKTHLDLQSRFAEVRSLIITGVQRLAYDSNELVLNTTEIVKSYVGRSSVSISDLPDLIQQVHSALLQLGSPVTEPEEKPTAAVSIKKSVTPEYLICLDDGKKFKSLKRHLSQLGMTPDEYRTKWGLPSDYPMVASAYAAARSAIAKELGLGRKPKADVEAPPLTASALTPKKRGRKPTAVSA